MTGFQWRILILTMVITVINFIDRGAMSYAILPMQQALHLTTFQFGAVGSGFGIGYLVMNFVGGLLVDRYGAKLVWSISAVAWSLATIAVGGTVGFTSLLIARIALGLAEGCHFPAFIRTVATWLSGPFRSQAIAFGILGIPLSLLIGSPIITFLMTGLSWRWMFVIVGSFGLIWVAFWLYTLRHVSDALTRFETRIASQLLPKPSPDTAVFSRRVKIRGPIPLSKIFFNPVFLTSSAAYFAFAYTAFFASVWLPGYFEKTYGLSSSKTGLIVMIPWAVAGAGVLFAGWIGDRLLKKTHSLRVARSLPIAIGSLVAAVFLFLIGWFHRLAFDVTFFSLGLGAVFFINAPICTLTVDLFKKSPGRAQGLMSVFLSAGGVLAPILTGWLVQLTGKFDSAVFVASGLFLLASLLVFCLSWPDRYATQEITS